MPKNKQQEAQEKRLQKNIRQAKKTRADAKQGKTKSARSKPSKKGGFFAGLKADAPQTVQQLSLIHIYSARNSLTKNNKQTNCC